MKSSKYSLAFLPVLQAAVVLGISYFSLRLDSYDLSVPFQYAGDSIIGLLYIKGLLQEGWPTVITQLSAPFTYSGAAFPMLTSVDWLFMKVLSLFTKEPGAILNIFWLLTIVFSAWASSFAGYQLGLSRPFALFTGVLYAFLPYALLRNVAHLSLVYYLVPLLCMVAVMIATGCERVRDVRKATTVGMVACVLQGFDYIYYSFFAVLIFALSAALTYRPAGGLRQFRLPILGIALIVGSTATNLAPAFISKMKNGAPPDMSYKHTAEAEIYGAKIRRMITPHPNNVVPILAKYAQKDNAAKFPGENENVTSRLGLYGAAGLVLSMIVVLRQGIGGLANGTLSALSSLGVAVLLVITVGGWGAVFNVLTVPDIRAYNRFSVFLSFFSMIALGLWIQSKIDTFNRQGKILAGLVLGLFALFSLYDQLLDRHGLLASQEGDMKRARNERNVVEALESALPKGASVLQLPFTGYPPLAIFHKMESYDHGRAYLWSKDLKWSWPSFSLRHRAWQQQMTDRTDEDFIKHAIYSGFDAIWIDKAAYADGGVELISSFKKAKLTEIPVQSDRIVVLDLTAESAAMKSKMTDAQFMQAAKASFGSVIETGWADGFYEEERSTEGFTFRWSRKTSAVTLRNGGDEALIACVRFSLASPQSGEVSLTSEGVEQLFFIATKDVQISLPILMPARHVANISLRSSMSQVDSGSDSRSLYFYVKNYVVDVYSDKARCVSAMR